MDFHKHVFTVGEPEDIEVQAAQQVTCFYGLPHVIRPRGISSASLCGRMADHFFQTEGEIGIVTLIGNFRGKRKMSFTGHEVGFREAFVSTEGIKTDHDLEQWLAADLPLDPIHVISDPDVLTMRATVRAIVHKARLAAVPPADCPNWFNILGRGSRWVGKLTSSSGLPGMYVNPLCSTRLTAFAQGMGQAQRRLELLHFAMLLALDPGLLKLPFASQVWPRPVLDHFGERIAIAPKPLTATRGAGRVQLLPATVLERDGGRWMARALDAVRHNELAKHLDYDKLIDYVLSTRRPGTRQLIGIYNTLSASVLLHAGGCDRTAMVRIKSIAEDLTALDTAATTIPTSRAPAPQRAGEVPPPAAPPARPLASPGQATISPGAAHLPRFEITVRYYGHDWRSLAVTARAQIALLRSRLDQKALVLRSALRRGLTTVTRHSPHTSAKRFWWRF